MKITIPIYCSECREWFPQRVSGMNFPDTAKCARDHTIHLVAPLGNLAAMAILGRAGMEMREEDWTLTIVLSAMAIESQLAYLFMKWKKVDLIPTRNPIDADEQLWVDEWREIRSIGPRLEKVSQQLVSQNFDAFCHQSGSLLSDLHAKYPASQAGPLKKFFIDEFFNRRNRIVHSGKIDYELADAHLCYTSATTLWLILEKMEKKRQQALR